MSIVRRAPMHRCSSTRHVVHMQNTLTLFAVGLIRGNAVRVTAPNRHRPHTTWEPLCRSSPGDLKPFTPGAEGTAPQGRQSCLGAAQGGTGWPARRLSMHSHPLGLRQRVQTQDGLDGLHAGCQCNRHPLHLQFAHARDAQISMAA